MKKISRAIATSLVVLSLGAATVALQGCSVARDQSSVGEFVDDSTITTKVKALFVKDEMVAASAISAETLNGTVLLSGFAKTAAEKSKAEELAKSVKGVKSVKNAIVVRN